jgi:hypothetical protein
VLLVLPLHQFFDQCRPYFFYLNLNVFYEKELDVSADESFDLEVLV